ncbi:hypothetical protein [Methylobacterium nodulans]|uniref:Uncharacterized protein n=1 Tax=Methylobacterium nodulans (strain LMG 21967 / CNCM I-2342 / ORS 2060) TaxID=460265 RepID=B8IRR5_METNO|nr:hypothetical protein [Methylobacterium nodulans]ACL60615.1 hypothetical protein Mnod_5786 [Methylobacterium nodulans ORS 2060]
MALFDLTPGLHRGDQPVAQLAARTHKGQAHFAGTGPAGKQCRQCARWMFVGQWRHGPAPSPCGKYRELMRQKGKPVPYGAAACKFFEPRAQEIPLAKPVRSHA